MSNNIYDILKKIESLEAPKQTLTEGKKAKPDYIDLDRDGDKKEPMKKAAKEKSKGAVAEAVARVEKQLSEKFRGFKKSSAPEIGSNLPKSDTETFGLEPGRAYDISTPKDWKPGDKLRDVRELIPTKDKKDHIRSRLGKHVKPAHLPEGTVEESGLMYHAGVKKHGRKYMDMAKEAGQKGASQEELGRLKDKHSKAFKNKKMDEDQINEYFYFDEPKGKDRGPRDTGTDELQRRAKSKVDLGGKDARDYKDAKKQGKYKISGPKGQLPEGAYNEEMLSPKQKKIASMAGDPDKIDAKDFAALRGEKKGKKDESNKYIGNLMQARKEGKKKADLDGDGDMEKVKPGMTTMREGWEEMQKYLDKKRGPESKGGAGKKAGTRYGGSAQKDDDEETDGEGKPVEKKKGRPKGTGQGAKHSFKKPKD